MKARPQNQRPSQSQATNANVRQHERAEAFRKALKRYLKPAPPRPKPAPARMPLIWEAWHTLPAKYSAGLRRSCLERGYLLSPKKPENTRIGRPCPKFGPEDAALLEAAKWWDDFTRKLVPRAMKWDRDVVLDWLVFRDYSVMRVEEVATYRTAQELRLNHGKGWLPGSPPLNFIEQAKARHLEFCQARRRATDELNRALFSSTHYRPLSWERERKLPVVKELPFHIGYAVRHAAGLATAEELGHFMVNLFPELTPARRREYVRTFNQRLCGRGQYGAFACWLADNIPVFERYGWRWKHIGEAAEKRFKKRLPPDLCKFAHKRKLTWGMADGPTPSIVPEAVTRSAALLTPAPQATFPT